MKINIFEGARRIVKLIMLLSVFWYVVYVGIVVMGFPYVNISYLIKSPGHMPNRLEADCESDNLRRHKYGVPLKNGNNVLLILCFETKSIKDSNGEMHDDVVDFQIDQTTGRTWFNDKSSPDVSAYTERTINTFVIPAADEKWVESKRWSALDSRACPLFPAPPRKLR